MKIHLIERVVVDVHKEIDVSLDEFKSHVNQCLEEGYDDDEDVPIIESLFYNNDIKGYYYGTKYDRQKDEGERIDFDPINGDYIRGYIFIDDEYINGYNHDLDEYDNIPEPITINQLIRDKKIDSLFKTN